MNDDYDVVEMDFPEYREEQSPIPDVENKISFSAHKEEIYRRNRLIAAEEQTRLLKEREREKAARCEETEELYRDAEEAEAYVFSRRIAAPLVIAVCVLLSAIVALVNKNSRAAMEYAAAEAMAETTVMWQTAATEKVTRITTERTRRETEAKLTEAEISVTAAETAVETAAETTEEIHPEILKTAVVREPFAEDGNSYVYNTGVMSYRFTAENGGVNEYGIETVTINVSVKNLTDYGYLLIPSFNLSDSVSGNHRSCSLASYDRQYTHFSSPYRWGGDEEWHEGNPIAFSFDENSLCEISLSVYFDAGSDIGYDTLIYDSQHGFPDYTKEADVGFELPLDEILKYPQ